MGDVDEAGDPQCGDEILLAQNYLVNVSELPDVNDHPGDVAEEEGHNDAEEDEEQLLFAAEMYCGSEVLELGGVDVKDDLVVDNKSLGDDKAKNKVEDEFPQDDKDDTQGKKKLSQDKVEYPCDEKSKDQSLDNIEPDWIEKAVQKAFALYIKND